MDRNPSLTQQKAPEKVEEKVSSRLKVPRGQKPGSLGWFMNGEFDENLQHRLAENKTNEKTQRKFPILGFLYWILIATLLIRAIADRDWLTSIVVLGIVIVFALDAKRTRKLTMAYMSRIGGNNKNSEV